MSSEMESQQDILVILGYKILNYRLVAVRTESCIEIICLTMQIN